MLLGNLFELEDLGAKDLKGISGPVRAFAALRASSVEGRFEALHGIGLTDLIGRTRCRFKRELLVRVGGYEIELESKRRRKNGYGHRC